ncbi:hydroxymethylbilane synthase [Urechidicola croceus]|uniref:Porphobilinogen deaminase n=1 Tax=Urechidicola croceus TaxID=1850246 RepID=A0A1D8P6S0_9FLAO|nr:hydroxymethylbilane synthase [Urechidicola croceus]AOW20263.1 hydroxymethylbilane synthase [Urechidicola croceus]
MNRTIRIGTRSSELALWQANLVAKKLEEIEGVDIKTEIVKIDSQGDLQLDKPLYELGITGVFTKNLDIALLNGEIDIAVHSMKDVPTVLPKKIVQAAVLKRAGSLDVLVTREGNEEFLYQPNATIATGSLRRKAQWLHHYPDHTIVGLRGNVNTRMEKLKNSNWNGAVFAQAGLQRVKLLPKDHVKLDWMVPAPAQGIVMIAALESDTEILNVCKDINHTETELCAHVERQFLNTLEGGCTAPIGALAFIREKKLVFKGALFSLDGKRKIEIDKSCYMVESKELGKRCAEDVLERGGDRILKEISADEKDINILSTKQLATEQTDTFNNSIGFKMSDFIAIRFNRLKPNIVKNTIENVVITSQNGVEALLNNYSPIELDFTNIYCVGRRTKRLIQKKIGKVTHSENSAKELADYIASTNQIKEVTYFCGESRRDELKSILTQNKIKVNEVEAYRTILNERKFDDEFDGVLFYSPSGVESYIEDNKPNKAIAFCIGETTAKVARKYFEKVEVAKLPTIESVIKLVNQYYEQN